MSSTSAPGRYVTERQIGRGGMATVWKAHDTVLERDVALKRLRPALLDDGEIAERFRREAEAVAGLSHPGIVRMLDRGEDAEGPFLVMELVEGEDLKARIKRDGPLPPDDARRICAQVARALEYAHGRGLVHRDIKSQNVLLDAEGNAKLTDFGIARLMEGPADSGLTRTGMMVGSSDYLAPEQAEGRAVDGRTDIYALGIVLWECLTGKLPFPGESFVSVAMRHVTDALPDPRSAAPGVPAQLAACAMRAAAKRPEQRFQGAGSFAHALEEPGGGDTANLPPVDDPWHRDQDVTGRVRREPKRTRKARLGVLAGVIAAAVVATGGYVLISALGGDGASKPTPVITTLPITVKDFDPQGGDGENRGALPSASDNNLMTAWTTEKYQGVPEFGGYPKTGVGLLLMTNAGTRPTEIDITSTTPGATFEIRRENELDATKPPIASGTFDGKLQKIALPDGMPQRLVVWITRLVPVPDDATKFWAGIGEVSVRGVANTGS
ncbi:MAG: serine/threonine protein kinase [Thermoleophilia bacterium]|nr:serine/threonine protein kinase [Thermoleophilia bacterium]